MYIFSFENSLGYEFGRFLKAFCLLVLVPSIIAVMLVQFVAWRTGAIYSIQQIAELQHDDPDLIWTGAGQLYGPFHLARISIEQPKVVVIGHSRCGQLRSMMFKPYSFQNACVSAWTLEQVKNLIDLATKHNPPQIVMFTLDYFMLGDAYTKLWQEKSYLDFSPYTFRTYLDDLLMLGTAFNRHPGAMIGRMPAYLFGRAHEPTNGLGLIGPWTIAARAGFRSDGSLLYDKATRDAAPTNTTELPRLIAVVPDGDGREPAADQMKVLEEIGELGRQRHVTIVGIQLPIIQGALDILDSDKDWNQYRAADRAVWKLMRTAEFREKMRGMGINFFDLSHDPVAQDSRAFIDPAHPAEYGMGMALADTFDNDPAFRAIFPRLDVAALRASLAKAKAQGRFFDVYGAQF